jgi:hypothetical protein
MDCIGRQIVQIESFHHNALTRERCITMEDKSLKSFNPFENKAGK